MATEPKYGSKEFIRKQLHSAVEQFVEGLNESDGQGRNARLVCDVSSSWCDNGEGKIDWYLVATSRVVDEMSVSQWSSKS